MKPTEVNGVECLACDERFRSFEAFENHDCGGED